MYDQGIEFGAVLYFENPEYGMLIQSVSSKTINCLGRNPNDFALLEVFYSFQHIFTDLCQNA